MLLATVRIGPWRKDEDERFLQGIQEVMRVKTFEDAYRITKIPWMSIFPYVRVSVGERGEERE